MHKCIVSVLGCFVFLRIYVQLSECFQFKFNRPNEELYNVLWNFTKTYNSQVNDTKLSVNLTKIGTSLNNNSIWAISVTAAAWNTLAVPNVKFVGNVRGNQAFGRELILYHVDYLLSNYKTNSTVQWLLNNTRLHFVPTLNPDGYSMHCDQICQRDYGRYTIDGEDLNDQDPNSNSSNIHHPSIQSFPSLRPETEAMMNWSTKIPSVLTVSFFRSRQLDTFTNTLNANEVGIGYSILIRGTSHNSKYYDISCFALSINVHCGCYSNRTFLKHFLVQNTDAIFYFTNQAHTGIAGIVTDMMNQKPVTDAVATILQLNMTFSVASDGQFFRLLPPGINYTMKVQSIGYLITVFNFSVEDSSSKEFPELTKIEIILCPILFIFQDISFNTEISNFPKITRTFTLYPDDIEDSFFYDGNYNKVLQPTEPSNKTERICKRRKSGRRQKNINKYTNASVIIISSTVLPSPPPVPSTHHPAITDANILYNNTQTQLTIITTTTTTTPSYAANKTVWKNRYQKESSDYYYEFLRTLKIADKKDYEQSNKCSICSYSTSILMFLFAIFVIK